MIERLLDTLVLDTSLSIAKGKEIFKYSWGNDYLKRSFYPVNSGV